MLPGRYSNDDAACLTDRLGLKKQAVYQPIHVMPRVQQEIFIHKLFLKMLNFEYPRWCWLSSYTEFVEEYLVRLNFVKSRLKSAFNTKIGLPNGS